LRRTPPTVNKLKKVNRIFKKREREVTLLPVKSRAKERIPDTRVNNKTNTNAENSESMVAKVISV
jgi:negative regulator of replication initiation